MLHATRCDPAQTCRRKDKPVIHSWTRHDAHLFLASFDFFFTFFICIFFACFFFLLVIFFLIFLGVFFRLFFGQLIKVCCDFAGRALFTKCICGMSSYSARARATPCAAIKSRDVFRDAGSAHFPSLSLSLLLSLSTPSSLFLALIISSFLGLSLSLSLSTLFLVPRSLSALHLLIRRAFPFPRVSLGGPREMPDGISCSGNACREKLPLVELSWEGGGTVKANTCGRISCLVSGIEAQLFNS